VRESIRKERRTGSCLKEGAQKTWKGNAHEILRRPTKNQNWGGAAKQFPEPGNFQRSLGREKKNVSAASKKRSYIFDRRGGARGGGGGGGAADLGVKTQNKAKKKNNGGGEKKRSHDERGGRAHRRTSKNDNDTSKPRGTRAKTKGYDGKVGKSTRKKM